MLTPIQVMGIGLDGAAGLSEALRGLVERADLLVGSDRHLSYFPHHPHPLPLGDLRQTLQTIRQMLAQAPASNLPQVVILTSGDPLFFGFGRLLLAEFPPEWLTFHPHLSAVQLAFSRVKVTWQDARLVSAHGRSLDELTQALQQGAEKIAVLTDGVNTPAAIAQLLLSLDLPTTYRCWVCENLGGSDEQVAGFSPEDLLQKTFQPLNVVILLRDAPPVPTNLPLLGLPDASFVSFGDRPGLMTKREVRILALGELALQPGQVVWDIGAGTGSVSVEVARLCPDSQIYAIEKTAAGIALIEQNSQRLQVANLHPIHGTAPAVLEKLPSPDRIFMGGSGGNLQAILTRCGNRLNPGGRIVLAIATLQHLTTTLIWVEAQTAAGTLWQQQLLQVQLARSIPIANLTRFAPLNPVTLVSLERGR